MAITSLSIQSVRNIDDIHLSPAQHLNVLVGPNGSGKTSILEAIYFLGMGRSFRAPRLSQMIQHEHDACMVTAKLPNALGIKRLRNGETQIRYAGESLHSISELAQILPIQLFNQSDYQTLSQAPQVRRAMLDWGVFHVEQSYIHVWKNFKKALKQRNSLLKQGVAGDVLSPWDGELALWADKVDSYRADFCQKWFEQVLNLAETFPFLEKLRLLYRRGWPEGENIKNLLANSVERDKIMGFSLYGPQKADITVSLDNKLASQVLSLGQQKVVSTLLKLALSRLVKQHTSKQIIHLIDDLPADLDSMARHELLGLLLDEGYCSFLACVDLESFDFKGIIYDRKMFHVEHGTIKK